MSTEEKKKTNWRKILIGEWNWKRPFKLLFFVYTVLLVIGLFFANIFLFPYPDSSYTDKISGLKVIKSADGTSIATRFWKAKGKEKALILYFHGNAVDIGMLDPMAAILGERGFSMLSMDYRGYGLSGGKPSEKTCYEDAETLYSEALNMGYGAHQIILWGRSLGGGTAVEFATRKQVKGLVLESTFCTAFRVMTHIPILPFDKFNNLAKMQNVEEPLFVFHGENDAIIAPWHTQKLIDAHQGESKRIVIQAAGHNNVWTRPMAGVLDAMETLLLGS